MEASKEEAKGGEGQQDELGDSSLVRLAISVSSPASALIAGIIAPSDSKTSAIPDPVLPKGLDKSNSRKPLGSWAALFREANIIGDSCNKGSISEKIRLIQTQSSNEVVIDDDLVSFSRSTCEFSLHGKFYGRTPPLGLVQTVLPKIWKTSCSIQIVDLASSFFCFKFGNGDYLYKVLAGGPWFLRDQVLLLIPWRPNFQPLIEKISTIPIWLQLPGLPLEYIQTNILLKIASCIGQPIKVDEITLRGQRAKFARICVLWDLDKPIPHGL
ncbi:hypothetical protein Cni_G28912 [Canna indica]|uniref:DUF4283 domain-containing protein n=1 Tax=Canna indica TaxID=4628 RepID=A0AAQ3L4B4_9LILI|nr:hypothetical protein Cni_G28912 [Canna indica]